MDPLLIVLRVLHIGAGILWVGAAWTFFLFIEPTLKALGTEVEKNFMAQINRTRKITPVILAATVVTVGAGAILYWIDSGGLSPAWFASGFGRGITIGAVSALMAFALGPLIIVPTFGRMEKVGAQIDAAGGPPTPAQIAELEALGRRVRRVFAIDFVLLVVAVFFMATARYL